MSEGIPTYGAEQVGYTRSILLSLPIVLFALLNSLVATFTSNRAVKMEGFDIADGLYLLFGYPLTGVIHIFTGSNGLRDTDSWWALPLLTILFLFQWVIWAQLIVLIGRVVRHMWRCAVPTRPTLRVWPDRIVKADGRRFRLKSSTHIMMRSLSRKGGDVEDPLINQARQTRSAGVERSHESLLAPAKPTTILINEGVWETRFLIGHGNSLLHKKTRFQV